MTLAICDALRFPSQNTLGMSVAIGKPAQSSHAYHLCFSSYNRFRFGERLVGLQK
jgi:hypothetical protein